MYTPNVDLRDARYYNPVMNSNLDYWQRIVGTAITRTQAASSFGYNADRFITGMTGGGTARSVTIQRSTDVPIAAYRATYSYLITNNTATGALGAAEWTTGFQQPIEGIFLSPFNGSEMTFGVWLKASLTGNYAVAFRRNTQARSYVSTVTINSANTWEYKIVNIPWDTGGPAQAYGTGNDFEFLLGSVTGTTFQAPSLNTWTNVNAFYHPSALNWFSVAGSTLRIAQPQLRLGRRTLQEMRDNHVTFAANPMDELNICCRYYEKTFPLETVPAQNAGFNDAVFDICKATNTRVVATWEMRTQKRAFSVITTFNPTALNGNFSANPASPVFESAAVQTRNAYISSTAGANTAANNGYYIHATLDAEI